MIRPHLHSSLNALHKNDTLQRKDFHDLKNAKPQAENALQEYRK